MIHDDLMAMYLEWFRLDARAKTGEPPPSQEVADTLADIRVLERLVDDPDHVYFAAKAQWREAQAPRCDATQTGVRCDLTAGHPGPHGGPDRVRADMLTSRLYWGP